MTTSIHLIAVGKNKDSHLQALIDDYRKRLTWDFSITEIPAPNVADSERKAKEADLIRAAIHPKTLLIVLDERGDALDSISFAKKIENFFIHHSSHVTFVIGGADGLDDSLRKTAAWSVGFGKLTWPHMMVRLMLVEQLYRAGTILAGHPYHRV